MPIYWRRNGNFNLKTFSVATMISWKRKNYSHYRYLILNKPFA